MIRSALSQKETNYWKWLEETEQIVKRIYSVFLLLLYGYSRLN